MSPLLDPAFLAKLDRLDLVSRKLLTGKLKGERRSKRWGASVEFADYRNYVVGDDLRFIDWNIYARLDKLFLKLFLEEEDLALHILIDASASCDYGEPPKFLYIQQLAAALGYVGLVNYNRVSLSAMAGDALLDTGPLRGRTKVPRILDFLGALKPAGAGDLPAACKRFALSHRAKGVCVVISDFFDKAGHAAALKYLVGGHYDLFAIHVLSPQELDPPLQGDLKLRDIEDGQLAEVSITGALLKRYHTALDAWRTELRDYLTRRGGAYIPANTAEPFDALILQTLRRRGLLG